MNKFISDFRALSPAELLIVLLTPVSLVTLSAAIFFG